MKNVSSQFRRELNNGNRNYVKSAKITLKDETELTLTDKVFWNNGVKIEESTSNENSFDIGSVIVGQLTLSINNMYDDYSEYDFTDAKITNVSIGIKLSDNTIESLQYGQYTVNEAKYNGSIITLTAYDNMYKFDQPYTKSTLSYPATLLQIVQDSCSKCDVQLGSYDFPHNDFIIQNKPEDESITFRNILQWVAQISCCYCKMDPQGRLVLNWYNTDILENISTLNGGNFLNWEANKDTVSGGNFNPWTQGELISAGTFSETSDYHTIHSFSSLTLSTDDVVITGVRVVEEIEGEEGTESKTYQSGMDGYVLSVEGNKLIQGSGATVVGFLVEKLVGLRFRPFTASSLSDPTIESGDIALLSDRKGNTYKTIITSNTFQPGNYQNISCGAEAPARKSAQRYSQATQIYVDYRKEIQKERTEREKALEELGERLEASTGVFTTIEEQSDGSKIYYLHNKPSLDDSDIVWKMTAEAWGVSTDGGKTWNAGMTVDGDTIVRILTATGVNADWIKTGALQISDTDGNIIFLADMDTKQIIISGDYVQIGGKTAGAAINDALQESKDYSDGKLADFADTVTGDLSSIQAQIDGQIETFYEDYEPSLQNYPANEWTSTEERQKHEGDLFYWKSKGYAYRFFQDGATWKWQLVQDTDITQAMAAAEKAQDTADGKRRVFVVTPQPPYDIGDLWTNGEDILTCSTARPAGSVYVSTDWKKLNTYTDDTVANEALEEAKKARSLNIILDNEYQGIYADSDGNIGTFPVVETAVQVLYGHTDVSVDCTYSIAKSSGVTGSWNGGSRTYAVTGLSTDAGWVDITASYLTLFTATKRFNVEKIKGGENGQDGVPGRTYFIEPSQTVLKQDIDYNISPGYIDFNAYYRDGQSAQRIAYSGRFKIEEEDSNGTWTNIYTSTADESSVRHILYDLLVDSDGSFVGDSSGYALGGWRDVANIRVTLYASGGTSTIIDQQTVPVVKDGDPGKDGKDGTELTPEDVFNILTNYGEVKGIYKIGNQLYISFTYARGGELVLGGANNGNGLLKILDASGNQVGYIDNTGVHFNKGTFSGTLSAATGSFSGSVSSSNAIITGGYINISTDDEYYSLIELIAGNGSFRNSMSAYGFNSYNNNFHSNMTSSLFTVTNGDSTSSINPGIMCASDDPTGNSPYNYDRTVLSRNGIHTYSGGGLKSYLTTDEGSQIQGNLYVWGNIGCNGTKNRIVDTESYSNRKLYSYEMPSPIFGDIGKGAIDQNGECYIFFDDIFSESVNSNVEYQVFLQKESQGDLWVEEKTPQYFLVKGTENLNFAWEVKARQKKYEYERLEIYGAEPELEKISYETEGLKTVDLLTQEYIQNSTFNVTEYYMELEGTFI